MSSYTMKDMYLDSIYIRDFVVSEAKDLYKEMENTLADSNNSQFEKEEAIKSFANAEISAAEKAFAALESKYAASGNSRAEYFYRDQGATLGWLRDKVSNARFSQSEIDGISSHVKEMGDQTDWLFNKSIYGKFFEGMSPLIIIPNIIQHWNDIKSGAAVIKGWFSDLYTSAQQFLRTVFADPLVLDMDGDGIETLSVNSGNPVYFDFNSDGTKTNTGWISPDDAYLVFDRNDNGVIDDASELFSDYTPLYAGGRAANGFAALAQEDTTADGVVNHLDANWNHLKIWQDINSDGISQANELFTMQQAGVVELNISSIAHSQVLANGNQIADLGTYLKTDGSFGTLGEVSDMADVNLTIDTFHREFPDAIPVSEEVAALPDLQGSGLVRDLQQAAELSPVLQYLLTQYSQATTRQAQMAIIDQLLYAWADTSGLAATMESRDYVNLRRAA